MKTLLLIFALLFPVSQANASRIIYGDDDRQDYASVSADKKNLDNSVVSIWDKTKVVSIGGNKMLQTVKLTDSLFKVCKTEKFASQASGAYCSGSLVGEDLILTAGHCALKQPCNNMAIVFGFNETDISKANKRQSDENTLIQVPNENVYYCSSFVSFFPDNNDIALIKLDRKVTGRKALNVDRKVNMQVGDSVFVIGHPLGSTLKVADNAHVRFVQQDGFDDFFAADLDAFAGNSGSPVFSSANKVVGVLTDGGADFNDTDGNCNTYYKLAANAPGGESIRFISSLFKYLPQQTASQPVRDAGYYNSVPAIPAVPSTSELNRKSKTLNNISVNNGLNW